MNEKQFHAKVWAKLLKHCAPLFKRGDKVLVGVSGGVDSVCLLHFLVYLSKKKSFKVFAVHLNHGLRKEAAADAAFSKKFCKSLDVECYVEKANVKKIAKDNKLSIEHAARKARYAAFEKIAKKVKANKVALAHHLDDHVETVFLNILRGTNAKGLCGIPLRRPLNAGTEIVRPFLNITKNDVLNYAKFNRIVFVEDASNSDDIYTRNWVRARLIPLLEQKQPKLKEHIYLFSKDIERMYEQNR